MTFSLVKEIIDEITCRRIRNLGDAKTTSWPSQAGVVLKDHSVTGRCVRSVFYEKMKVPVTNPVSERVQVMGYMGKEIENGIVTIIKNRGLWEANNIKWQKYGLSGEVDVIIKIPEEHGGGKEITEVKSIGGYYANKSIYGFMSGRGDNKKWNPGAPKDPNLMQAAIYADIGRDRCDGCRIIYVSRDEARLTEFLIKVDEQTGAIYIDDKLDPRFTIKEVYARYRQLEKYLKEKVLPPVDFRYSYTDEEVTNLHKLKIVSKAVLDKHLSKKEEHMDKGCLFCGHRDKCKEDDSGTVPVVEDTTPAFIAHGSF